MVYLQHQQSCPLPSPSSNNMIYRRSSSSLPMGDDMIHESPSRPLSKPTKHHRLSSSRGVKYYPAFTFSLHRVMIPLVYLTAMWSCGKGIKTKSQLSQVAEQLATELEFFQGRHDETLLLLEEATAKQDEVSKKYKNLKSIMDSLKHEMRMKEEMAERVEMSEDNRLLLMETLKIQQKKTTMTWISERQEALFLKVGHLQEYVQQQSRQQVLQKYGPGPHRIEFQVRILNNKGKPMERKRRNTDNIQTNKFMVELASIDVMPHAVETFLDMVSQKVWDNTVFYHHVTQSHVVAAAPVEFGTFEPKLDELTSLGFTGLSFPEYSDQMVHEEFTLGFSGRGPNFYINSMDNTEHHGPGGQPHHDLVQDADPCFAKVVWGKEVIQNMMMPSSPTSTTTTTTTIPSGTPPQTWQDYDVTQIVQVRMV